MGATVATREREKEWAPNTKDAKPRDCQSATRKNTMEQQNTPPAPAQVERHGQPRRCRAPRQRRLQQPRPASLVRPPPCLQRRRMTPSAKESTDHPPDRGRTNPREVSTGRVRGKGGEGNMSGRARNPPLSKRWGRRRKGRSTQALGWGTRLETLPVKDEPSSGVCMSVCI